MYCNKTNVNQLTVLMKAYEVSTVIVCPGSRNAALVHNFNEDSFFNCYEVTDERSAGFIALGMATQLLHDNQQSKVAICVTSGSAILNLQPAIAEAYYRNIHLLVISADRPAQWINQNDGQTLIQKNILKEFSFECNLCEPLNEGQKWWNNRLLNDALHRLKNKTPQPIHINVPITEPLFEFTIEALPEERIIHYEDIMGKREFSTTIPTLIQKAQLPLLIVAQNDENENLDSLLKTIDENNTCLVISEICGNGSFSYRSTIMEYTHPEIKPDLIFYVGGAFVNKRWKEKLRSYKDATIVRIDSKDVTIDTLQHTDYILRSNIMEVLIQLSDLKIKKEHVALQKQEMHLLPSKFTPQNTFNDVDVCNVIFQKIANDSSPLNIHLANSSTVRWGALYFSPRPFTNIFCNRGVNGIEGCLSTAAGHSLVSTQKNICIIGDLAFFYDCNALWQNNLKGNLRILLLNNNSGDIHRRIKGLDASPALERFVVAPHSANARGIAESYHIHYLAAHSYEELFQQWDDFYQKTYNRPLIFELFTDAKGNEQALKETIKKINSKI